MRIVTIDIGNSNPHIGIFQNNEQFKVVPLINYVEEIDDIKIVSSVNSKYNVQANFNLEDYRLDNSFFKMPVHYSMSLGIDRLTAGFFAFHENKLNQKQFKTLVIDAGTFITIDTIDELGFQGGFIFPGIRLFMESFHSGSKLPHLEFKSLSLEHLPQNTEEAILGASNIYLEKTLEETIKKTSPSNVIITGGSSEIIKNIILKTNLKVELQLRPHFLHQAMHSIYLHHLKDQKAL